MKTAAVAKKVRWTVKDYFLMAEAGLFDDRRVELIDGEVIEVPAQANPHRTSVTKISRLLFKAFGPNHWVVVQGTLILPRYGAPDPDFHVFDVPEGTPDDKLPLPLVVIEVSDTTYLKDSTLKLREYARAGIEDYWIVNLPARRVEVYRDPENPTGRRRGWRYATTVHLGRGEQVRLLKRPKVSFDVSAMLP
jgi:Uma2 family endonuclease